MKKTAVLLVNFGGPRSLEEVPQFMRSLTGRQLPPALQQQLEQQAIDRYRLIGGCSPLPAMAEEHARLLTAAIGGQLIIKPAFRYSHPSIEETIDECHHDRTERILFLIMTPFYTSRTVGNYIATAEGHLHSLSYHPEVIFIHSWYKEPLFIECWEKKIRHEAFRPDAFYLFSAHSLPQGLADEPYKGQIEETTETLVRRLQLSHHGLGWQSVPAHVTEPWIGPTVEAVIDEAAAKGFRTVVQVPIGFVTDHMETLYDIDIVHKKYAEAKGLIHRRISSLNTDPLFIEALKRILSRSSQKGS
ncbi:MAG: ferrochelatase [Syntrophales bacterium LBB04]|nr:ferrochelatase [Syntrophales bacterium LBB04]